MLVCKLHVSVSISHGNSGAEWHLPFWSTILKSTVICEQDCSSHPVYKCVGRHALIDKHTENIRTAMRSQHLHSVYWKWSQGRQCIWEVSACRQAKNVSGDKQRMYWWTEQLFIEWIIQRLAYSSLLIAVKSKQAFTHCKHTWAVNPHTHAPKGEMGYPTCTLILTCWLTATQPTLGKENNEWWAPCFTWVC